MRSDSIKKTQGSLQNWPIPCPGQENTYVNLEHLLCQKARMLYEIKSENSWKINEALMHFQS